MTYTISQVAEKTKLSIYTLRYYDKEGLLPFVERTPSGTRKFKESDLKWLSLINCLKNTGMPLKDIREFISWCMEGDTTLEKRLNMFTQHRKVVEAQMSDIQKHLDKIDRKITYYTKACEAGTEWIHEKQLITNLSK